MKDHELREMIDELTKTAKEFSEHQSLRERLKKVVFKYLKDD